MNRIKLPTKIYLKKGWKQNFLLLYYVFYIPIIKRVTSLMSQVLGVYNYVENINLILNILVAIVCLDIFVKKLKIFDYIIYIGICIIFNLYHIMVPNNIILKENLLIFLFTVFPIYFIGRVVEITEENYKLLYRGAVISIFVNYIVYFVIYKNTLDSSQLNDNMALAYVLLPSVLIIIHETITRFNVKNILYGFFSIFIILIQGTRGPMIILFAFILYDMVFLKKSAIKTFIISLLGICISVLLVSKVYISIVEWLKVLFENMGVSTRVLDLILTSEIMNNNGRDYIQQILYDKVMENKYIGYGPYGDVSIMYGDKFHREGAYAHNILLELWVHYGIFFGTICLLIFLIIVLISYVKARNEYEKICLTIFISISLIKFIFSGSYLMEYNFYFLMGICMSILTSKKMRGRNRKWKMLKVKI